MSRTTPELESTQGEFLKAMPMKLRPRGDRGKGSSNPIDYRREAGPNRQDGSEPGRKAHMLAKRYPDSLENADDGSE